jgi:hypothetical protein
MVHLPPDPHILASFANANLPWWKALAELVDNSLDAGATRVVIDISNRVVTVSDDGLGCEDITSVFKLGEHKRRKSSKRSLGRYGIGAKDAWLSCADTMEVVSHRGNTKTSMRVNYTDWMQSNWNVPDPIIEPYNGPSGTVIKLPLRPGKNSPDRKAIDALAFAFTPAIRAGIQIVSIVKHKRDVLTPCVMPMRSDVVQSEFAIDGKSVAIDIGILPDGVSLERGPFWLIYGHRVIEATSIGVGQYSARRLGGTITIGDGWALAKNKDDLTENQDRLADAIFVRIEHVLKKADQLAETIESAMLRNELQEMLNSAVTDANSVCREKRQTGSSRGTATGTESGRKRRTATLIQDGSGSVVCGISKTGRRSGYILDWTELDPSVIGSFDRPGMRVSLNLNNGIVSLAKTQSNRAALTACAVALIADHCCRHDDHGNSLLKFSFSDFSEAMGTLVKDYKEEKQNAQAAV